MRWCRIWKSRTLGCLLNRWDASVSVKAVMTYQEDNRRTRKAYLVSQAEVHRDGTRCYGEGTGTYVRRFR